MNFRKIFKYIVSLPKTIYFNFKVFSLNDALKLPVFVSYNTVINYVEKGCIEFGSPIRRRMCTIGMGNGSCDLGKGKPSYVKISGGVLHIANTANFLAPAVIDIDCGEVRVGKNFNPNSGLKLLCGKEIVIGDNCLVGWNVTLLDGDGHKIFLDETKVNAVHRSIHIGDHVWLCAEVTCLKGADVPDNSIVGYGSIVSGKKLLTPNTIYGEKREFSHRMINHWEI